jgi:hypothetical protein
MRLRWFCLGVLVGIALAPADGRTTWHMIRDQLARMIDALLRFGSTASFPAQQP